MIKCPSPNFGERRGDASVDMLVLHYTDMLSCQEALDRLCDAEAEVSAHYLVDEDGQVYSLVAEDKRAWHAGVSYWRGERDVNSDSIGIELVNAGWLDLFEADGCTRADLEECLPLDRVRFARHALELVNLRLAAL